MQAAQHSFVSSTYWTESVGPTAALASLDVMSQVDVPAHVHRIGESFQQGLGELASKHRVPLKVGGYPALTTLGFEHPDAAALLTLFTSEMLAKGFLVGGAFYPTLAHTAEQVENVLAAADEVFAGLGEAVARDIVRERLKTPVKHSGFARLN